MSKNKNLWKTIAFATVVVLAALLVVNFILHQIGGGSVSGVIGIIERLITVIALVFVVLSAYGYVDSKSGKKYRIWLIIYILSVIVLVIFYVLPFIKL